MLLNGKPEELKKYSKGIYDKEAFVQAIKDRWELTDLQIREAYLVADLAVKADGVFSVSYGKFVKMFEERFDMEISLSSVRRFFGLLEKLGVLTINEAIRKNNKKSANIYIVEPLAQSNEHVEEYSIEQTPEQSKEHSHEHTIEQIGEQENITKNKAFKNTSNKTINIPLTTSNSMLIDNQLRNKYPHVPFSEIKQQILDSNSLMINNINQYKGILEFRLNNWKPGTKKSTRKELLPDWFDEKYYYQQFEKSQQPSLDDEQKKSMIEAKLAAFRKNG